MARAPARVSAARIRANKDKVASYLGAGIIGGGGVTPPYELRPVGLPGQAGTVFEGFKVAASDEFLTVPTRWTPKNPVGRYTAWSPINGARVTAAASSTMLYVDPEYRGRRSQAPVSPIEDRMSVTNGVLKLLAKPPTDAEKAVLPRTFTGASQGDAGGRPNLLAGSLQTWPSFMLSAQANHIQECFVRMPGSLPRQYFASFWSTSGQWPDYGEIDVFETDPPTTGPDATLNQNVVASTADGNGATVDFVVRAAAVPKNQMIQLLAKRDGNTVIFYDDAATPGTLVERARRTGGSVIPRIRGAHAMRLDMATSNDGAVFSLADWLAGVGVEFERWAVWTPAAAGPNTDLVMLPAVKVTPGGSWAATLPTTASLSGGKAGIEQVTGFFDNPDAPGFFGRGGGMTRLPRGMTVDLATRQVSGTVPHGSGGRTGLLLTYAFDDGTPAARAFLPFDIAPVSQALDDMQVVRGASGSISIPFTAFHSGNLGPHVVKITSDKSWVTVANDNTASPALNYVAPSADETATLTFEVSNALGDKSTFTRTLKAAASAIAEFRDDFEGAANAELGNRTGWAVAGTAIASAASIGGNGTLNSNTTSATGAAYVSTDLGSQKQSVETVFTGKTPSMVALSVTDQNNYIGLARLDDVDPSTQKDYLRVMTAVGGTRKVVAVYDAYTANDATLVRLSYDPSTGIFAVKVNGRTITPTTVGTGETLNGDGTVTLATADRPPATSRAGIVVRSTAMTNWLESYRNIAA